MTPDIESDDHDGEKDTNREQDENGRDVNDPPTEGGDAPAEPLDIDADDVEKALPGGGSGKPDSPAEEAEAQPPA